MWCVQCRIANVVIQVDGDTDACQQDMWKFLKLYEQVEQQQPDLRFSVTHQEGIYHFTCVIDEQPSLPLWSSLDDREVSAALEIHFYSQLVQYLYQEKNILSIHAAVLGVGHQAVMFAGESGAGKSSMCTAGLLSKASYLSDEFTLLAGDGQVYPFPRPMQWEHKEHPAFDREEIERTGFIAADYFDFPDTEGATVRCHLWHPAHVQRQLLPLKIIVLHQYDADLNKPKLTPIPRHEALLELPQHLHIQAGMAKDLPLLNQRIDQDCVFYRLRFPDVFAAWQLLENEVF
jgi:hypothetical protein